MKQFKKLLSFLTIICCLAGSVAPAYAAETETGFPTATFTNKPKSSPDLYVTKQVESAVDGYTAPSTDVFQFVLMDGNDKPVKDREYRVFDQEGGEVFVYSGSYIGNSIEPGKWRKGAKVPYKTSASGLFTLQAGQTAWFEAMGTGTGYKIKEYNTYLSPAVEADGSSKYSLERAFCTAEGTFLAPVCEYEELGFAEGGYSYQSPVSGSTAAKEILAGGSAETFINRYLPPDIKGKAALRISKSIDFPQTYTAPETPDFWFLLKVNGQPYAEEAFTVEGPEEGETTSGKTDREGRFSLKGGQSATFSEVPEDVPYQVEEILEAEALTEGEAAEAEPKEMPEGWWSVGEAVREGSTGHSLVEERFVNRNVSFGVSKTLSDYQKPDVDFTFKLTDELGNAMGRETYLRYYTTGEPVYEEKDNVFHIAAGKTEDDGTFTLKPGEAAIFIGIKPGTSCRVKELVSAPYTQIQPAASAEDVRGVLVEVNNDEEPTMVSYINQYIEPTGKLTVAKTIKSGTEDTLSDAQFHFVLYKELKTYQEAKTFFKVTEEEALNTAVQQALGANDSKVIAVQETEAASASDNTGADNERKYLYTSENCKYKIYTTVEGKMYSVPKGPEAPPTFKTGPDDRKGLKSGEFILGAEQMAVFDGLLTDRAYLVRETGLSTEYRELWQESDGIASDIAEKYVSVAYGISKDSAEADITGSTEEGTYAQCTLLSADGASLTFVNQYTPKTLDLHLHKTDGIGNPLPGAEFMLYLTQNKEYPVLPKPAEDTEPDVQNQPDRYISDEDGNLTIEGLHSGIYWLYELKAPSGYSLLKEPIKLEITRIAISAASDSDLEVRINGILWNAENQKHNQMIGAVTIVPSGTTPEGGSEPAKTDELHLTVKNTDLYELPNSGGIGIYWYTISGTLLMLAAILILYKRNLRREGLKD